MDIVIKNNLEDLKLVHANYDQTKKVVEIVLANYAQIPKPKPEVEYNVFLTVTFAYLQNKSCIGMFKETINILQDLLRKFCDYEINPEFTLQGRIHYHIMLNVKDKCLYQIGLRKIRKLLGNTDVQYIKNTEQCKKYCHKDTEAMSKLLKIDLPITGQYVIVSHR